MNKKNQVLFVFYSCILLIGMSSIHSCKKDNKNNNTNNTVDTSGPTYMEKMFEAYVLNQPVIVTMAIDSAGNNLTQTYLNEVIYLRKDT